MAEPHKGYFIVDLIAYCIAVILLSVATIVAAKTINCMYEGDWNGAFFNLILEIVIMVVRNLMYHLTYETYVRNNRHIRLNIANKVYNKFLSSKSEQINELTIEKVTNIALNNMTYIADFPDEIIVFLGKIASIIFTLIVVFMYSPLAGVIILALGVVNFAAYYLFNKKLGKIMLERYEKKDDMFKSYSKIINGKSIIKELHATDKYKQELTGNVESFVKSYNNYYLTYSAKINLWYIVWNLIVYAITAFLLYKVSNGTLDIAVYLIIVPYLKSVTESLNSVFDKTSAIENMRVDVDRINLILNLEDEEIIQYGTLNNEVEKYNLGLIEVDEYKKAGQKYTLSNVNMNFATGKVNVVKGPKGDGKRVIFDILRRYNVPDKGKAVLDNLNLYDYNESTFKSHINYCASHPSFIKGSIKENLMIASKDFGQVEKLCQDFGIYNEIHSLDKGFDTDIKEIKSSVTLFILGLIRALLSNCKILMIYELPYDTSEETRTHLIEIIKNYYIDKTIIIFTHTDDYDDVASKIYSVVEGKVEQVK